ncbi:ribonuclease HII [Colletotrichum scovillei]|uniref:Ribonuclease n=1 Tax=Colletotrichum scovillei TaxID=1209932 RepID=A0A9P7UHX5_9PEZI|nr:ribonuclease HII [Colletotrichum scovillei]KAF4777094.1 ribonuclease HII [Colletotrichum scovillei]KAG7053977.1 ribonuclease h2 subunit a [Colletotrichum scovillei]KAG7072279.1 ribonuclease h2 subunit a [Colletotrichum scovillei]KAG7080718.1 ribonuclease h2 subunit a [Colletotrichum scovillei]
MEDSPMVEDIALETPVPGAFVPPSINEKAILSGDSYTYFSPVPSTLLPPASSTKTSTPDESDSPAASGTPVCLGVDEAGRGPVLGPMVYGVFYLPIPLSDPLLRETHHFDDSKVLTPAVRSQLMTALCTPGSDLAETCGFAISALSARDISSGMMRPGANYNLNAQAMDATVDLIKGVFAQGVNIQEIYVDTVGQPAAYQAKLQRFFPATKITVAKKADSLYPCVSAASVCAKVTRDVALEVLYKGRAPDAVAEGEEGMAWGSGYPSDGRCVSWMRSNMHPVFGWGPECRFSWGTAKDMLEAKGNPKVEWPVEDDGDTARMTDYFASGNREEDGDELGTWFGRPAGLEAF